MLRAIRAWTRRVVAERERRTTLSHPDTLERMRRVLADRPVMKPRVIYAKADGRHRLR